MALTQSEAGRLADLARLDLLPDELRHLAQDLDKILDYVGRLGEIDTKDVEETAAGSLSQLPADDQITNGDPAVRELIVTAFPDRLGDALRVPAVFQREAS